VTVWTGIDRIAAGDAFLPRAKLGILTNHAARTSDGRTTVDVLLAENLDIHLLLAPEHGLDVAAPAGSPIPHASAGSIPVLSMYGANRAPVEAALDEVDVLVIDLPDAGCRYYTYPWTMRELLKMAARHGKQVIVLDRPNPLGGEIIEGNIPDPGFDSAVCSATVPVRHGLTLAELARWQVRDLNLDVDLFPVRVSGWTRSLTMRETRIPWIPPSPNLQSPDTLFVYPGTCLLEGTTMSEGRGTAAPFQVVGAPALDSTAILRRLRDLPDVTVEQLTFIPESSKWAGEPCQGVRITTSGPGFRPVLTGLALIEEVMRSTGVEFLPQFDALAGTGAWRRRLVAGEAAETIANGWTDGEESYRERRDDVLLYPS
jgi:uncharacterized protein YbbC (DUF1343 family)